MKKNYFLAFFSLLFSFAIQAQVTYSGNGNSGFGGPIGAASMSINDDGTTITFTFTKGGGDFNDTMAMYISTGATGRSVIDGNVNDTNDSNRRAISNTGSGDLTFPAGFQATYAVAINTGFGGLWSIPSAGSIGANGLVYVNAVGQPANATTASFSFSFDWSEIGLTNTDKFDFVITYGNPDDGGANMYSSDEAFGDGISSTNPGAGAMTFTESKSYPNTWTGTTDNDWDTATNWTEGTPTATQNVYIPKVTNQPTASGAVTVNKAVINSGASVITQSTFTGNVTYNLDINDTNWHLVTSPVEGEGYDATWVVDNLIDDTTDSGTNVAIASYINTSDADGDWVYVQDNASGTFNTGQGYSIKRDATGSDISFTGTLKVNDASISITANDIGGGNENRWTLIGNPFPSYISVTSLLDLAANKTALEDSREAIYVWDNNKLGGAGYSALTSGYIYPGQGFFVNSNTANENIAINQNMLSHQTGQTLYKNTNLYTSINLMMTDGTKTKSTEINYIANKTKGLDPRFDIGTFTGTSTSFNVFTQLVNNNKGVNFMRQALPNTDLESMVIPVGVKAEAGKEITFSAEALNLPSAIKVFLEDRTTNSFTRLDEENSQYKVTLTEALNGTGRFYLHTSSKSTLNVNNITLESISIYKSDKSTLRIVGLQQGNASVKLFNLLGKQVLNSSFKTNRVQEISIPELARGIYIVQLRTEIGTLNKKIIVE